VFEAERRLLRESKALEQRLGEPVIVVAGDQQHLAAAHRLSQLLEEGACDLQHFRQGQLAQLEHVAEQDDAVGRADLCQQCLPDARVAQQVFADEATQVQVGDDRSAHPINLNSSR
jgi:hypothetical protein